MFILDFFLGGLMDQLIDWIYSQLVGFFGNFFAATTIYLWLISLTASKELSILLLKLLECR